MPAPNVILLLERRSHIILSWYPTEQSPQRFLHVLTLLVRQANQVIKRDDHRLNPELQDSHWLPSIGKAPEALSADRAAGIYMRPNLLTREGGVTRSRNVFLVLLPTIFSILELCFPWQNRMLRRIFDVLLLDFLISRRLGWSTSRLVQFPKWGLHAIAFQKAGFG